MVGVHGGGFDVVMTGATEKCPDPSPGNYRLLPTGFPREVNTQTLAKCGPIPTAT